MYDGEDRFKVNDVIEVVGILSRVPDLPTSPSEDNAMMETDDRENGMFGAGNAVDYVTVVPFGRQRSPKYALTFERYKVTVRNMQYVQFEDTVPVMLSILQHILDVVLAAVSDQDFVRLRIESS